MDLLPLGYSDGDYACRHLRAILLLLLEIVGLVEMLNQCISRCRWGGHALLI